MTLVLTREPLINKKPGAVLEPINTFLFVSTCGARTSLGKSSDLHSEVELGYLSGIGI